MLSLILDPDCDSIWTGGFRSNKDAPFGWKMMLSHKPLGPYVKWESEPTNEGGMNYVMLIRDSGYKWKNVNQATAACSVLCESDD